MVKRNKRKKAWVGAAISALGALASGIMSVINTNNQIDAAQNSIDAQRKSMIYSNNAQRVGLQNSNLSSLLSSQQEEQNKIIPTQNSAFKLGGRRCKKCGGSRLIKFI